MSPSAGPWGRTICQSALAPGISVPLSSGPANVPPIRGTIRRRPCATLPTSRASPRFASKRKIFVRRGSGSRLLIMHSSGTLRRRAQGVVTDLSGDGPGLCRVVRMVNERRDGRMHPLVQGQRAQKSVKFLPAAGAIEAKDRGSAGPNGRLPQPDQVPPFRQGLCRGSFCRLAVFDFGRGHTVGDVQLEPDEKLHHRLLAAYDPLLFAGAIWTSSSARSTTRRAGAPR